VSFVQADLRLDLRTEKDADNALSAKIKLKGLIGI